MEKPCINKVILSYLILHPRVLVALIQCGTMAFEVVEVATESEEDVRFRYLGKNPMRFPVFGPPLRSPLFRAELLLRP